MSRAGMFLINQSTGEWTHKSGDVHNDHSSMESNNKHSLYASTIVQAQESIVWHNPEIT
jgi:hypothetical protein